jgi:geranylgeranyl diphosphate synthase, type I
VALPVASPETCPALEAVQDPVNRILSAFLDEQVAELTELDPELTEVGGEVRDLVAAGGKRLRPAFTYWGHRATGAEHDPAVLTPAAAVELLHTFALIHDDVMDRSPERRGRPAVHEALAAGHAAGGLTGDHRWFGIGGSILAGDLAFVWADRLLDATELPADALDRVRRVFTALRVEVMAGQYLDLRLAGRADAVPADALRVALLKSGRYTATRPLQLGAAVTGADELTRAALAAYGDAVGIAFQLRDDVLGLFGDPATTGKGAVEDLREGKRTVLVLRALELADPSARVELQAIHGNPDIGDDEVARARSIIAGCGALEAVERLVSERQADARSALAAIEGPAADPLDQLAGLAAFRSA